MPSLPALLRALLVWVLIALAETAQGSLRRFLFGPELEFFLRQVSVITGALIIFAITWACGRWLRVRNTTGALAVGGLWVALTFAFEIAIGWALGLSWTRIWSDYNLIHGGLMPLGLLAMGLTPWAVQRMNGLPAPPGPPAQPT